MSRALFRLLAVVAALLGAVSISAQSTPSTTSHVPSTDLFSGIHEALDQHVNTLLADEGRDAASIARAKDQPTAISPLPQVSLEEGVRDATVSARPRTPAERRLEELRPLLNPILRREGIPLEIAFVIVVESDGRADALSPKGARGLWQLMPETARRYGLMVEGARDERLDVEKSTRAATQYLRDLHAQFGSWATALAAYNAGEQAVQRAIDRAQSEEFAVLAARELLPLETRTYVPRVLNLMVGSGNLSGVSERVTGAARSVRIVYAERMTEGHAPIEAYEAK